MKFNNKYDILTTNGFESFDGIQKVRKKTIKLFFNDGSSLRGSFTHQVFNSKNELIQFKNIKKGDLIKSKDGYLVVVDIKKYYNKTYLYDIINSGKDNTYYTNNVLSHNCSFVGSGNNVISDDIINYHETNVKEPIRTECFDRNGWVFEDPIEGCQYVSAVDVSMGDGSDYSTIEIFNMDTGNQAFEWRGMIQPDKLGELAYQWAIKYNSLLIIDITGGYGFSTVIKLIELKYPWLHYSDSGNNNVLKAQLKKFKKGENSIPGFYITEHVRTLMIQELEIALRECTLTINSKRFIMELRTFMYINGRADHTRSSHDDLIITVCMILYVFKHSFKNVKRYKEQTLAMLKAWGMVGTTRPSLHNSNIDHNDDSWLLS